MVSLGDYDAETDRILFCGLAVVRYGDCADRPAALGGIVGYDSYILRITSPRDDSSTNPPGVASKDSRSLKELFNHSPGSYTRSKR